MLFNINIFLIILNLVRVKKIEIIEKYLIIWFFFDFIYYEIFRFDFMLLFYEKYNKYWYNVF